MPIFNLTDITFKAPTSGSGPLASLAGSKYDLNTYKYPIDLGNTDKAHYMVININEQGKTQFAGTPSGDLPTVIQNYKNTGVSAQGLGLVNSQLGQDLVAGANKIVAGLTNNKFTNAINNSNDPLAAAANGVGEGLNAAYSSASNSILNGFTRTIRRITDTVCLYMPDTLAFTYDQNYDSIKVETNALMAAGAAASAYDAIKNNQGNIGTLSSDMVKNLSPFAGALLANAAGGAGKILFAAATGLAQNPMMELLYTSPAFRNFQFDFMMYPRSEKEALEIQNIIDRLRFHQAPEVLKSGNGFFLVPPSEFDIRFMYNGKENPNIPKISTCVLKNIFTDYGQGGASFYEVPGEFASRGRTGMPVGIRLTLSFQETEIMTKESYAGPTGMSATTLANSQDAGYNQKNSSGEGIY